MIVFCMAAILLAGLWGGILGYGFGVRRAAKHIILPEDHDGDKGKTA